MSWLCQMFTTVALFNGVLPKQRHQLHLECFFFFPCGCWITVWHFSSHHYVTPFYSSTVVMTVIVSKKTRLKCRVIRAHCKCFLWLGVHVMVHFGSAVLCYDALQDTVKSHTIMVNSVLLSPVTRSPFWSRTFLISLLMCSLWTCMDGSRDD